MGAYFISLADKPNSGWQGKGYFVETNEVIAGSDLREELFHYLHFYR